MEKKKGCVYRFFLSSLEMLYHHLKVLSLFGWRPEPSSSQTPQEEHPALSTKDVHTAPPSCLWASALSLPAWSSPLLTSLLRKPSLDSNFEKHFFFQPLVQPQNHFYFLPLLPSQRNLSIWSSEHGSLEDTLFLHYFLDQSTLPKNEGTF